MIYFICDYRNMSVKIGYSNTPEERLVNLQVANNSKLELVLVIPGEIKDEQELHKKFINYNIRGEWFSLEGEVLSFIKSFGVTFDFEILKTSFNFADFTVSDTMASIKLLIFLATKAEYNTNVIELNKNIYKEATSIAGLTSQVVYQRSVKLRKTFRILKLNDKWVINPFLCFKGTVEAWEKCRGLALKVYPDMFEYFHKEKQEYFLNKKIKDEKKTLNKSAKKIL